MHNENVADSELTHDQSAVCFLNLADRQKSNSLYSPWLAYDTQRLIEIACKMWEE